MREGKTYNGWEKKEEHGRTLWVGLGRVKCLNCLSKKHFIKDCKEEDIWVDCQENRFFKDKSKEEEEGGEKNSFYSMDNENRKNIEEGIIDLGCLDSVVRNI